MSKIVSGIMDKLEHKPIYAENDRGEVTLSFRDAYHLQDFVGEIRKHGVVYGMELAKLTKEAPPIIHLTPKGTLPLQDMMQCANRMKESQTPPSPAISVVRWMSRGET